MKSVYLKAVFLFFICSGAYAQNSHSTSTTISSIEAQIDPVTLEVLLRFQGVHPTTSCHISSFNYYISQPEVHIELASIVYEFAGQAITAFDTTASIGVVSPGTYHINLHGDYVNSTIQDTNQYYFTVSLAGTTEANIEETMIVSPNPCTDWLKLSNLPDSAHVVCLFAVDGSVVKKVDRPGLSMSSEKVDLSDLQDGVYYLTVNGETGQEIDRKRIVKF